MKRTTIDNARERKPYEKLCGLAIEKKYKHTHNKDVKSINLHICGVCNYRCGFCFTRNLERSTLPPDEWESILELFEKEGVMKITIVGGEPTMHPQFIELCELAKSKGFIVSVVTNGSLIDSKLIKNMKGVVDWIGLSVDSPDNEVEKAVGRQCQGVNHIENIIKVADTAHENGIKVKLNITVIRQSYRQDFSELIRRVNPERVKAFQVLRVEGENEDSYDEYSITKEEWEYFVGNHKDIMLQNRTKMVFEGGDDMIDSYVMLDPRGEFIMNSGNRQSYASFDEVMAKGLAAAVDVGKYHRRGAVYNYE